MDIQYLVLKLNISTFNLLFNTNRRGKEDKEDKDKEREKDKEKERKDKKKKKKKDRSKEKKKSTCAFFYKRFFIAFLNKNQLSR